GRCTLHHYFNIQECYQSGFAVHSRSTEITKARKDEAEPKQDEAEAASSSGCRESRQPFLFPCIL
ncbi:hypothetical protein P4325_33690, partial [Bacillus thuringiensis]|nr:hypothetical protein [Bacillus thuringiensis]